jgi:hypothetical protein
MLSIIDPSSTPPKIDPSEFKPRQDPPKQAREDQLANAKSMRVTGIAMLVGGGLLAKFMFFSVEALGYFAIVLILGQKIIGLILAAKGGRRVYEARQMAAPTAEELLLKDCRRPVLYVRSFDDDDRSFDKVRRWMAWFSPGEGGRHAVRYEETVVKILTPVGPVIAIGRPSEDLPELGAARTYTSDAEWQSWVVSKHQECSLVLLQAGLSTGLRWEVERVFRGDSFRPTLVCFPPDKVNGPPPEDLYLSFKGLLATQEVALPESLGKSYCIWFPTRHRGELVPPGRRSRLPGTQNRLAPGFKGLWSLLEPTFPGIQLKVTAQRKRAFVLGTAVTLYIIVGGAGLFYVLFNM